VIPGHFSFGTCLRMNLACSDTSKSKTSWKIVFYSTQFYEAGIFFFLIIPFQPTFHTFHTQTTFSIAIILRTHHLTLVLVPPPKMQSCTSMPDTHTQLMHMILLSNYSVLGPGGGGPLAGRVHGEVGTFPIKLLVHFSFKSCEIFSDCLPSMPFCPHCHGLRLTIDEYTSFQKFSVSSLFITLSPHFTEFPLKIGLYFVHPCVFST
jgi:hypothetical protein